MMVDTINKWLATLAVGTSSERKGWSMPIDMADSMNYLSLDVLGDLCFGRPFGLLESDNLRGFPDILRNRAELIQTVSSYYTICYVHCIAPYKANSLLTVG